MCSIIYDQDSIKELFEYENETYSDSDYLRKILKRTNITPIVITYIVKYCSVNCVKSLLDIIDLNKIWYSHKFMRLLLQARDDNMFNFVYSNVTLEDKDSILDIFNSSHKYNSR